MSIRVHAVSRDKARCPFCREDLLGAGIPCPDCGATLHKECWADVRECPTLGCGFGATPASSSSSARARAVRPATPPQVPVARAITASEAQAQSTSRQPSRRQTPSRSAANPTDAQKRQAHISGSLAAYLAFCVTVTISCFAVPLPLALVFGCFTALLSYLTIHSRVLSSPATPKKPPELDPLEAALAEPENDSNAS